MDRRSLGALIFAAVILGVIAACLFSPVGDWLSIEKLKESRFWLAQPIEARPFLCTTGFFLC
nr:hypothetical protein [Sphingomonas sp.]